MCVCASARSIRRSTTSVKRLNISCIAMLGYYFEIGFKHD